MTTIIVTQARMTSTRLPGKVLREVLGKPLLAYQLERLERASLADLVVVATTINETDNPIIDLCEKLGTRLFRGSEQDVLSRFYHTAQMYHADVIVRVTSDCPFIDPAIIDGILGFYFKHQDEYDYVSNTLKRTFPRGMDVEVFSAKMLGEAYEEANKDAEREHVTPFFYLQPNRYRLSSFEAKTDCSYHRWTVDTAEDFKLIENIITELYPKQPEFSLQDILMTMERHPDWIHINQHIKQKTL